MPLYQKLGFLAQYAAIRVAVAALRLLPLDWATELAGWAAGLVGPRTSLHRRASGNLSAALPELSAPARKRILVAMWRNTGRVIAETMMLDRIVADESRIEVVGRETLVPHLRATGSNVCLTLHYGNWELVAWASALCGGRAAAIYRPLKNPYLDRYIQRKRAPLYPDGLLFKGTLRGTHDLGHTTRLAIDYLRRGGHLGFVCDQVEEASPFSVPFFGHDALFSPAPALLGRRLGAKLWIVRCQRLGSRSRFRVEVKPFEFAATNRPDADVKAMTAAMAAQFEAWIRETPEQWMWWQRRLIGTRPLPTANS